MARSLGVSRSIPDTYFVRNFVNALVSALWRTVSSLAFPSFSLILSVLRMCVDLFRGLSGCGNWRRLPPNGVYEKMKCTVTFKTFYHLQISSIFSFSSQCLYMSLFLIYIKIVLGFHLQFFHSPPSVTSEGRPFGAREMTAFIQQAVLVSLENLRSGLVQEICSYVRAPDPSFRMPLATDLPQQLVGWTRIVPPPCSMRTCRSFLTPC